MLNAFDNKFHSHFAIIFPYQENILNTKNLTFKSTVIVMYNEIFYILLLTKKLRQNISVTTFTLPIITEKVFKTF